MLIGRELADRGITTPAAAGFAINLPSNSCNLSGDKVFNALAWDDNMNRVRYATRKHNLSAQQSDVLKVNGDHTEASYL
jgi:hypothetical protein